MIPIHSPYLRVFVLLQGAFGLQLLPISITDCRSLIYLIINLSLNAITIYCIYYDSMIVDSIEPNITHKLYYHFLRLNFYVIYRIIYTCFICNYLLFGYRIIKLLDSPIFISSSMKDCHSNRMKALVIYLTAKLFWDHWTLVDNYYWFISVFYHFEWRPFKLLFGLYLYHLYGLTTWFLLYYHQIVTYLTLRQIDQMLTTTNNFSLERRIYRSFLNLSLQNRQIQFYFSLILATMFIEQSVFIVTRLCYLFLDQIGNKIWHPLDIYSHSLRFFICFALIEINRQNIMLFDHIERHFNRKVTKRFSLRFSHFNQLQLYRQYYRLSAFQLFHIDAITALEMFLFALSYVTIISLT